MVHGTAPEVPIKNRLLALHDYHRAYRTASFVELRGLHVPLMPPYRHLNFSGDVVPIVVGSTLHLFRPILDGFWEVPDYGIADLSQRLCTVRRPSGFWKRSPPTLECHILSLDDPIVRHKPEASNPVLSVSTTEHLWSHTVKATISAWYDREILVYRIDTNLPIDTSYYPDTGTTDETLFLIVPLFALLVTANRDNWGTGVGEDVSKTPAIPWVVWGEPCCRVLLQKPGSHWCIPDALGSMCLLTRFPSALEEPEFREFYICDFHPWARHGNVEDDAADLAQHCVDGVVDTASGLVQLRNLRDPIKNTLPFWVIRRDLTLDCADFTNPIVYRDRTFQVLLEDGVAAVYTKFSTDQSSTLYMLGV
ncbi:hypothetical protein C8Q77DRAFT_1073668 [Trametes polyzona]|nr:hypothetical protein C8Q77DRAFT_1073668 [Trametes polyzona]